MKNLLLLFPCALFFAACTPKMELVGYDVKDDVVCYNWVKTDGVGTKTINHSSNSCVKK